MGRAQSLTLGDICEENARRYIGREAFVGFNGLRATYPELDQRVTKLANAMRAVGVGRGDRVVMITQQTHAVLELLLACSKLGAVFCPSNWRSSAAELDEMVAELEPALVVWQETEIGERVAEVGDAARAQGTWVQHDVLGTDEYEELLQRGHLTPLDADIGDEEPLLAIYTAGWAGQRKAALLSSANLVAMAHTQIMMREVASTDRLLATAPTFHASFYIDLVPLFMLGGATVFIRRVDPAEICRIIEAERCTRAFFFSLTKDQIVEYNRDAKHDISSMRSPSHSPEWDAMTTVDTGAYALDTSGVYGQTEVSGMVAFRAFLPPTQGISGRTVPLAAVRLWDDEAKEVPDGEAGEIVVRGPLVMAGYFGDEQTAKATEAAGWRRTNDLGRREPDGTISFIGPKQRMIKSGVENIYPAEVEQAIRAHPAVADCGVIGVPSEEWIQTVKAIVVVKDGESLDAKELVDHVAGRIASYKKPRHVEFADAIPKTPAGQTDYDALDAAYEGGNYPGSGTRTL